MRLAILLLALAGPARADDDTARARAHFEIGNGMYRLGDYAGALREFAAGYELTRKPGFLINLAQTWRKLHDPVHAREMCQKYLASTPPEDPARFTAPPSGLFLERVYYNGEARTDPLRAATPLK